MRRPLAVAIAVSLMASCADVRQQPGGASDRVAPEGFLRIVRHVNPPSDFTCTDPWSCRLPTIASWPTITLTFAYRLSAGDLAHLGISASCPPTDPPSPCPSPVPYRATPLASNDGPMTTTVTWALPPGEGSGSWVYSMAELDDRSGDGYIHLVTRRVTAVFEMLPS